MVGSGAYRTGSGQVSTAVMLYICILEVPGSNLIRLSSILAKGFLVPPVNTACFHILAFSPLLIAQSV
jgi:hypothetical protein